MSEELVIGTRGSELALWQARRLRARLGGEAAGVRLEIVKTRGDARLDVPLDGGSLDKGAFTKELEEALLDGRVDLAVHSLKDLPTSLPEGLVQGPVPERADPGDVLLVREDALDESAPVLPLKEGALIGTGSPRRVALLKQARPDCRVPELFRGNVPTRKGKCVDGEVDAVVLARAGVSRLELDPGPLVAFDLDPALWLPAPAQGALGLELREGDERVAARLAPLTDEGATLAAGVERELLARLEAGCHAALGAWCRREGERFVFDAGLLAGDGAWRAVTLRAAQPEALAAEAESALEQAAPAAPSGAWAARASAWWDEA